MILPYAVYIIECRDRKFYIGFSQDLNKRLQAHQNGEVKFTKSRLPIELVHVSFFEDKMKAYDFERYLKTGSGVAFRNKRLTR